MSDPLVTIVTPSYNQGRFIRATIESVLTQDYPNIEYIVMDGASTDETAEVVATFGDRVRFISEKDRGQSHAINKGFAMARGEIVAWLNSDDIFLPGAVRHAVNAFNAHPQAGVVYGEGYQIDEFGGVKSRFPYTQHHDLWKLAYVSDYILQQTVFFKKSALDAVGPLREDLHYVMDWEILIRLGKRFDFVYVPEYMGSLREYDAAKTSAGGGRRIREIGAMLYEHTGNRFPPGLLVYGLASFKRDLDAKVQALPPALRLVGRAWRRVSFFVADRCIARASLRGQAWYGDGWAAPTIRVMLPYGAGRARLRGKLPGGIPGLSEQRVRIAMRGRELAAATVTPGPFELTFDVPETEECPILTVHAEHAFVFRDAGISSDKRKLGLFINDVQWIGKEDRA